MSIEGRIAIDVNFADSSDATGVQSLKKIQLADTTAYTSGKVAVVSGTCGTSAVTVASLGSALSYRDSAGSQVSFFSFDRMAMSGSQGIILSGSGQYEDVGLVSTGGRVAVCDKPPEGLVVPLSGSLNIRTKDGTASYTLVLYGT
jgi:hypothetical protein